MAPEIIIILLIIGAIAGWLAGQMVKGGGFGLIGNIIVGIIGALVAGWLFPRVWPLIGGGFIGPNPACRDRCGILVVSYVWSSAAPHQDAKWRRGSTRAAAPLSFGAACPDADSAAISVRRRLASLAGRIWPVPRTTYLNVVSCSTPTGPRACRRPVAMPISAPMPNSPPSANCVDALCRTMALSRRVEKALGGGLVVGDDAIGVL